MSHSSASRLHLELAPYKDFAYPRSVAPLCAGGWWEPTPETFRVEELPAYPFCGEGEHAVIQVEKIGLTTREVAAAVAQRLGLAPAAVGYAGMKDKAATTVQTFTITGVDEKVAADAFAEVGCRILMCTRHRNKLRLGHLLGNRFDLRVQGLDLAIAKEIIARLQRDGVPNYFGPQRFGAKGDNAAAGARLLRGELKAKRWKRDLLASALQSLIFNEVLAQRMESGDFGRVFPGDVLRREDSGGLFVCENAEHDQLRLEAFEISVAGPMPGRKMVEAQGVVGLREAAVLQGFGMQEKEFSGLTGTRRPLRVRLEAMELEPVADGAWLRFVLPAGAYATSVVRELVGEEGAG